MKNTTSLLILVVSFLFGIAANSYGQNAGDYVFAQTTDTLWSNVANWKIADGAGGYTAATTTPTNATNVYIPSGKRMGTMISSTSGTSSFTYGATTLTLAAANSSITVGMAVKGSGIAPGTYVTAVNSTTSITLSQPCISSGNAISLSFYPACKSLVVYGFIRTSQPLVVFGDITVNQGATLTQGSDLYCVNITNYGTFNSVSGYRSSKILYMGFNGTYPGNGDYTLINDGVFGDTAPRVPQGTTGGIKLLYSNQSNSVTIKPSSSSATSYAFNIAQIIPHSSMKTLANTTLNIKETMSLLVQNGIGLSVQNNDTCPGTTRICNIDPGVAVYLGYNFHANRNITTNQQGNFIYNIYGTLDLGSYAASSNNTTASSSNSTALSLCMSSVIGNTGTLTLNLGDGTQANAGTLILGSYVQMIKQATQKIDFNISDYSTVKFTGNYGYQVMYQLLNENIPALYLFPSKFYNLELNGDKAMLPVKQSYKGSYTNTNSGYGKNNWIAPTGTAADTTGTNSLYYTTLPSGSIVCTGSSYYYVPVIRTTYDIPKEGRTLTRTSIPTNDSIAAFIVPNAYITGTNIKTNTKTNAVTANTVTTSYLTVNAGPYTNVMVTFYGFQGTTAPTGTGTNLTPVIDGGQPLIYLGDASFATPTKVTTAVTEVNASDINVYSSNKQLFIRGAVSGDKVAIYNVSGIKVAALTLTSTDATINLASGIYIVKLNNKTAKVIVD